MLLPRDPALGPEGETAEDPRQELVDRLLEHERFKNAAEMLQQKRMIEENVWSNPQMKAFVSEDTTRASPSRSSTWSKPSARCWNGPATAPLTKWKRPT